MHRIRTLLLASSLLAGSAIAAHAEISVVASMKPVHSLVAAVMEGVGTPGIIIAFKASARAIPRLAALELFVSPARYQPVICSVSPCPPLPIRAFFQASKLASASGCSAFQLNSGTPLVFFAASVGGVCPSQH